MEPFSVVALFLQDGKVLSISRKTDHNDLGLPGGKIEPGDASPEAACRREVEEEADVNIIEMLHIFDHLDRVEGSEQRPCRCYQVTSWEGTPTSKEGAWVGWVPIERLLEPSCTFREYNRALFISLGYLEHTHPKEQERSV